MGARVDCKKALESNFKSKPDSSELLPLEAWPWISGSSRRLLRVPGFHTCWILHVLGSSTITPPPPGLCGLYFMVFGVAETVVGGAGSAQGGCSRLRLTFW